MKTIFGFVILALMLGLSSCKGTPATPGSDAIVLTAIQTAVAQTLTALATEATATPTLLPTATATLTPSATPEPIIPTVVPTAVPTQAPTATLAPTLISCDRSSFVGDITIPDSTVLIPNQAFVKTWKVENNGTCTWSSSYNVALIEGDGMGGVKTPIGVTVAPGQTASISVSLKAPGTTGTYSASWRLKNTSGYFFGGALTIKIVVANPTPTPTRTTAPTPTITPTLTLTPTPTGT